MPSLPPGTVVHVVDDDDAFRRVLQGFLRSAGLEVHAFRSPADYLRGVATEPACLVLDLEMPGMTGLALQEALERAGRRVPVVFLSGTADVRSSVQAMRAGAVDFLEKPIDGAQLLEAVERAVARGAAERAEEAERRAARDRLDRLTPREREVCDLVAQGLLNKQIGARLGTAEHTVKVHRGRAMEKLGVGSVPELVRLLDRSR